MKPVIERLKNYKMLKAEIKSLEIDIDELTEEMTGTAPICYEERTAPTNKFNSITENQTIDLMEKKYELEENKKKKTRELDRIDTALSALDDKEKQIIEYKYIQNKPWRFITGQLDITERYSQKIASEGISKIKRILKEEN